MDFPKPNDALHRKFQGKTVMVTGASSGIGLETARKFAANGARVLLVARSAETLHEAVAVIRDHGGEAHAYPCDLSDLDAIDAMADKALAAFGHIDILVNNAGITRDALLIKFKDGKVESKMSIEQWQAVIDVNLTGVFDDQGNYKFNDFWEFLKVFRVFARLSRPKAPETQLFRTSLDSQPRSPLRGP